ncbi:hypothetical protein SDC9_178468 [bioreactor metagenome]|uniref:Uncharacterized protein n=1 Tax=bioreactor metagenome TaxID=1076179 RepID=A0A645GWD7_9ZZZZ
MPLRPFFVAAFCFFTAMRFFSAAKSGIIKQDQFELRAGAARVVRRLLFDEIQQTVYRGTGGFCGTGAFGTGAVCAVAGHLPARQPAGDVVRPRAKCVCGRRYYECGRQLHRAGKERRVQLRNVGRAAHLTAGV